MPLETEIKKETVILETVKISKRIIS